MISDTSKSKWLPVGDKIIVKVEKVEKMSAGGIVLPTELRNRDQEAITEGVLIAKGSSAFDFLHDAYDVPQIGDKVCFTKYGGVGKSDEQDEYRILNDIDIHAKERNINA